MINFGMPIFYLLIHRFNFTSNQIYELRINGKTVLFLPVNTIAQFIRFNKALGINRIDKTVINYRIAQTVKYY